MTAKTSKAPRLHLRLPGTWLHLDPARPELTHARIRAFVEASIGHADQLAKARADLRKGLDAMLTYADGPAAHESTFLCEEIAPGVAAPIAVSVFAPAHVRMSPAIGTEPHAVITGFLRAMEELDDDNADSDRPAWQPLRCGDGWAARRWRVTTRQVAPVCEEQAVPTFAAEYWRTVPAAKRLMLITVTSPLAVIPQTMLRLADAIVVGSRFASVQPGRPHAAE